MKNEELYKRFNKLEDFEIDEEFTNACYDGDLDVVQYLLKTPEFEINIIQECINHGFFKACQNGKLSVVRYLLTDPDLYENANIHASEDNGLNWACSEGHLELVKYLLTSPELKEHANIHAPNIFMRACSDGHVEVVRYLLTSSDLKENANIHEGNDAGFKGAFLNKKLDIIQFLVFDMNIDKTKEIENFLAEYSNEQVENMFILRELNENLEKELPSDKINTKRMKV